MSFRLHVVAALSLTALAFDTSAANAQYSRWGFGVIRPLPPLQPLPLLPRLRPLPALAPLPPLNPIYSLPGIYSTPYYGYSVPYAVPVPVVDALGTPLGTNDLHIILPIASAKIWVNGTEMGSTGKSDRHLSIPDLAQGNKHDFKIKAEWTIDGKTKSEVRTVHLDGSGHRVVNFLVPEEK